MGVGDILLAVIVRLTSIVEKQYRLEVVSETGIRFTELFRRYSLMRDTKLSGVEDIPPK